MSTIPRLGGAGSLFNERHAAHMDLGFPVVQPQPSPSLQHQKTSPSTLGMRSKSAIAVASPTTSPGVPLFKPARVFSFPKLSLDSEPRPEKDLLVISLDPPAPFQTNSPERSVRTVRFEDEPEVPVQSLSKGQIRAIEYGKHLADLQCIAFEVYKKVVQLLQQNGLPALRLKYLCKDGNPVTDYTTAIMVRAWQGIIAIPKCEPEILRRSHFISGLLMMSRDAEIQELICLVRRDEQTEEEFVQVRTQIQLEVMGEHSKLIKEIMGKVKSAPKAMDLFGKDLKYWGEVLPKIYRQEYQELASAAKKPLKSSENKDSGVDSKR